MESHHRSTPSVVEARESLEILAADRDRLASRVAQPRWYYPALALVTALIVGSPGAATPGAQSSLVAVACVGLVFLSLASRRATGFSATRPAGRRSLGVAAVQGVLILVLLGVSLWLGRESAWVAATASGAFVTMLAGGFWYDRVYDRELRRGR